MEVVVGADAGFDLMGELDLELARITKKPHAKAAAWIGITIMYDGSFDFDFDNGVGFHALNMRQECS